MTTELPDPFMTTYDEIDRQEIGCYSSAQMLAFYQQGQRDLIEAMEQVGVIYHEYVYLNRNMEGMTKTTRKNVMQKSVPVYKLPEDTQK